MPSGTENEDSLVAQYAKGLIDRALGIVKDASAELDKITSDFHAEDSPVDEAAKDKQDTSDTKGECIVCETPCELTCVFWGQSDCCQAAAQAEAHALQDAPAEKEMVNHPQHYNGHLSEVECIDIYEAMEVNPGNAFKYVFRRDDKENLEQDLRKAIWYLEREIQRLQPLMLIPHKTTATTVHPKWMANAQFGLHHLALCRKVLDAETNIDARELYRLLFAQNGVERRISQMKAGVKLIKCLLGEEQSISNWEKTRGRKSHEDDDEECDHE